MNGPVANGITHQLNAIGAHDREKAHAVARAMIEAAAHWQMTHGGSTDAIAEHLQSTADTIHAAQAIARSVG